MFVIFLREFYYNKIIPFFRKYSTLESVNSELSTLLTTKTIQSLFTSENNTTIIKFYLVGYISSNDIIHSFFDKTYFPYLEENIGNEIKMIERERFEKIKSYLID